MNKQVLFILCVFLANQVIGAPRDIIDEVTKQLDELKQIVKGQILAAHDHLNTFIVNFLSHADNVAKGGAIAIQQEHETIIAQVKTLKELAFQANKNISTCTDVREQTLNRLPVRFVQQMVDCISGHDREAQRFLNDAIYIVDISINKVHHLEDQVARCNGNLICIQPLLTEIQLDMIRLPQNINNEVHAAASQLSIVRISVQQCADVKISEYSSDANSILGDITACVNRIIG